MTAELGTDPSAGSGREDGLPTASANGGPGGEGDKATRLQAVYKRLQEIDADGAEARAAAILAGLSFTPDMQVRALLFLHHCAIFCALSGEIALTLSLCRACWSCERVPLDLHEEGVGFGADIRSF